MKFSPPGESEILLPQSEIRLLASEIFAFAKVVDKILIY
jgi:hypothetical protein